MISAKVLLQSAIWMATLLQVTNTARLLAMLKVTPHGDSAAGAVSDYTYVGRDFPVEYPVSNFEPVAMTLQESVHYSLNVSDETANGEWDALDTPRHHGHTHLGPQYRLFALTIGHQRHCLETLHRGLLNKYGHTDIEPNHHHWQHCLNYLRQMFLCDAVDTLEEGDFMERDYSVHRISGDMVCRDWEAVFATLDAKQREWSEWSAKWVSDEPDLS